MFLNKLITTLKRHFVSGVLVVVPIILTYIVIKFLFETVDNILQPLIFKLFGYSIPGLGLVTTLLIIILAGIFTRNIIGNKLFKLGDYLLNKMPIIRPVYSAAKQLLEALTVPNMNSFKEVVLVEYPRKGLWVLGFVTGATKGEVKDMISEQTINVFIPTTPNPTSGFLLFCPNKDITYLDMSVEDAVKLVVSGGIVTPPYKKAKTPKRQTVRNKRIGTKAKAVK